MKRLVMLVALGTALFAVLPLVAYGLRPSLAIAFRTDPPRRIAGGFYPVEIAPEGLTFAWTHESFALTLPGLDRRGPWQMTVRVAASRPDGAEVDLVTSVDGAGASRVKLPAGRFIDHVVAIGPRADSARSTAIGFRATPTFVPPGDPRVLGVQVDRIDLAPAGGWPRFPAPWLPRILMGAAAGSLAALVAVPTLTAVLWLAATALASSLIWSHGLAPYAGMPWLPVLGVAAAAAAIAMALLPRRQVGAAAVVLITYSAAALQMLLLSHPDMPLGDALFHAHRFQDVLGGRYYFTSIAPGDYQFPYPIGLYVLASPFARFTRSALENAALLRIGVVLANAVGAAMLYRVVARWRPGDEGAAGGTVAVFHLMPLSFGVIATGNLTNAFSQAVALAALAAAASIVPAAHHTGLAVTRVRGRHWLSGILLFAFTTVAFLSHTGTFAVLAVQLFIAGAWLLIAGSRRPARSRDLAPGLVILSCVTGAAIVAVLVYYAHFGDVYRDAFARIGAETGRATDAAGGRTPWTRLVESPQWIALYYGAPALVLFGAGLMAVVRTRASITGGVGLLIAAWLAGALLFLGVGIVTPVDVRHFYAALPAVASIAGLGLSWLWKAGAWPAAGAVVVAIWAGWTLADSIGRFLS